ncbi:MAG: YdbH domain-containing protein [Gammaproteobacteria bacterium]|nr:YdbH domain-containing protein [Gammaproteobacteria bacterium]
MAKKKIIKKIAFHIIKLTSAILSITALLILCVLFSPWKIWITHQAEDALSAQGIENPKLTIKAITPNTIIVKDITIGTDRPISLSDLEIGYDFQSLWTGRLNSLSLKGLDLSVSQSDHGWQVQGFSMPTAQNPNAASNPNIPMSRAQMAALPFNALTIEDSHFSIFNNDMKINAPFSAFLGHDISFTSDQIEIQYGSLELSASNASLEMNLNDSDTEWIGTWSVADISSSSMTSIAAKGELALDTNGINISGDLKTKDKSGMIAKFALNYEFANPEKMMLTINSASMPWGGGIISVKNITVPVFGTKAITMPVQTKNVSINDVMSMMTGEYVRATGTISGMIPVIIGRDGVISVDNGSLKANEQGQLSMPPELIPGQGEQIELTRQILKDFQYNILDINIEKINANKISVLLAIKGNNPDMYNGREVHLNVRLSGDLLEIIRSNAMLILQPETLIKQK